MNLSLISKYRTPLMGFSALLILICHSAQYGVSMPLFTKKIVVFGNIGVDIFLFLSGVGCYYSLSKCKTNPFVWYWTRLKRIWIPYTLTKIPLWFLFAIVGYSSVLHELYRYSTISYWTLHDGDWYIALLLPLYLLTPFLYSLFEKCSNRLLLASVLVAAIIVLTNINIEVSYGLLSNVITNIQIAFERVSSFVIGVAIAPYIKQGKEASFRKLAVISLLAFLLFHKFFPSFNYAWIIVTPICLLLSYIFSSQSTLTEKFLLFFSWLGSISLESYIANVGMKEFFSFYTKRFTDLPILYGHYIDYFLVIVLGLLLSHVIHNLCNKINIK